MNTTQQAVRARGCGVALVTVMGLVATAVAAPPAFTNVSVQAGVAVEYDPTSMPNESYGGSACVGDFNRDGFQDIYVCAGAQAGPDHLFINNGDGTFTDKAAEWGCDVVHNGKGITVGDYNNDGWLDVYVVSAPMTNRKLWRNDGGKGFTNVAAEAGITFPSNNQSDTWFGCFGDYDLDGDLDLFSAGFSSAPAHNDSRLFRNNGDGTFTDVTASIGLWSGIGSIAAFAGSFTDMDGDRYPELLVTADFKCSGSAGSQYWKNDGDGTFTVWTDEAGVGLEGNGMGQTQGDVNNDGRCDWYTTTIAGFCSGDGNRLYRNTGNHTFGDIGAAVGVDQGGYGWGAIAVDVNHDGHLDLGATNGPGVGGLGARLFMNNGNGTSFTNQAVISGLNHQGWGRSMIHFDMDNDGDQDVAIHVYGPGTTVDDEFSLFRNDLDLQAGDTHWLRIFLDTTGFDGLAPDGYGSKVSVKIGEDSQHRWIDGGNSHLGISELSAHFGVGEATVIDEVKVLWNDGTETVLTDVPADQTMTITPVVPVDCPADLDGSGSIDSGDLNVVLGGFGINGSGDTDGDGDTDSADLNAVLGVFGQDCK